MGQYRPEHRVGGSARYGDIDHRPLPGEQDDAVATARRAGLWRFDERVLPW